jgi:hypothetical protein
MAKKLPVEFLRRKRDFSPLLVHLTKDVESKGLSAKDVLIKMLTEKKLLASNHYCLFDSDLKKPKNSSIREKFKVVCFTETPIDLIDVLLTDLEGRYFFKPKPFGLVFTKEFIKQYGGNPVFYVAGSLFNSLWRAYEGAKGNNFDKEDNKFLALVNRCDDQIDFHWEREWRVVGNLKFELNDIFCALCPEDSMSDFEENFNELTFIDPEWGIYEILEKLVKKVPQTEELPF